MSKIQLDRLKDDLAKIDNYISKVKKQGNLELVEKLTRKKQFLSSRLAEVL